MQLNDSMVVQLQDKIKTGAWGTCFAVCWQNHSALVHTLMYRQYPTLWYKDSIPGWLIWNLHSFASWLHVCCVWTGWVMKHLTSSNEPLQVNEAESERPSKGQNKRAWVSSLWLDITYTFTAPSLPSISSLLPILTCSCDQSYLLRELGKWKVKRWKKSLSSYSVLPGPWQIGTWKGRNKEGRKESLLVLFWVGFADQTHNPLEWHSLAIFIQSISTPSFCHKLCPIHCTIKNHTQYILNIK